MKVLVVLCAVVAGGLADASLGYNTYSAYSPLTDYSVAVAPFSYAYKAPIYAIAPYSGILPMKSQYHSQNELGVASYGHDEPGQSHHAIQDAEGNKFGSFSYTDYLGGIHVTRYYADAGGYRVESNDVPIGPAPASLLQRKKRQAYNGPAANIQVTPSGHLAPTPEVSAATNAHLAEVERQSRGPQTQTQSWNPQANWQGQPQTLQSQTPAWSNQNWQTPAATARTWEQSAAPAPQWNSAQSAPSAPTNQYQYQAPQAPRTYYPSQAELSNQWSGAQAAIPQLNNDGHLRDTPEVAREKALHFQEYNKAATAASMSNQEDDGSYKPEAPQTSFNQISQSRAWDSNQGAQPQQWSGQPWQSQPAAPQLWNSAQSRAYPPQGQTSQPQASWQQPQATQGLSLEQQSGAYSPWAQQSDPSSQWGQQGQAWQSQGRSQPAAWDQSGAWNQPRAASQWDAQPAQQSGGIPDTPEVAAAKAEHFRLVSEAQRAQRTAA